MPAPAALQTDLFSRAVDAHFMLTQFQRLLPALATVPIRVTACEARPARPLKTPKQKLLRVVYRVTIEAERGRRWEHTLVGTMPVAQDFLGPEVLSRCRAADGHPAAGSFRRLSAYAPNLQMAVLLFPVDPGLPGLAEVTGPNGARLLAPHVEECRQGAQIIDSTWLVRSYRPSARCVLRMNLRLARADRRPIARNIFVKVFADDRGVMHYRNMQAVWEIARRSACLRVPEPLGYDPQHRLLILSEAPEEGDLTTWIAFLENDLALPDGVGMNRVERCLSVAARALSELQRSRCDLNQERTYRIELAHLQRDAAAVRGDHAELTGEIERVLDLLGAQPIYDETLVPAHGGFRHRQTIGDEQTLTVLDWDGLCLANPALDAATFLGRLRREPLRRPGRAESLERLAHVFRREFLRCQPDVAAGHLAAYESLLLTEHALRVLRRPARDNSAADQARQLLAAAEALLNGQPAASEG